MPIEVKLLRIEADPDDEDSTDEYMLLGPDDEKGDQFAYGMTATVLLNDGRLAYTCANDKHDEPTVFLVKAAEPCDVRYLDAELDEDDDGNVTISVIDPDFGDDEEEGDEEEVTQ